MSNLKTEHEIEIDKIHDRQLAEKDAEIQRLKAERQGFKSYFEHMEESYEAELAQDRKLITELCDAVEWMAEKGYGPSRDLLQRAREATRCQP